MLEVVLNACRRFAEFGGLKPWICFFLAEVWPGSSSTSGELSINELLNLSALKSCVVILIFSSAFGLFAYELKSLTDGGNSSLLGLGGF